MMAMDTKGQLEVIIHQMIASGEKVNPTFRS